MAATLRRTHPLVDAMKEQGIAVDENPNAVNDVLDKLAQKALKSAEDKSRIEAIKAFTQPPAAPDPFDSFTKVAPILGLADSREDRRLRQEKEERERAEAIERREREEAREEEKRDAQRRREEAQNGLETMKFVMQLTQAQADTQMKMMAALSDNTQKMIEKMDANFRETIKQLKEDKPQKSDLQLLMEQKMRDQLMNPQQPPNPLEEIAEHKKLLTELGVIGGNTSSGPDWQMEYNLRRDQMTIDDAYRREQLAIEKIKAEASANQIGGGLSSLASILAAKFGVPQPQQENQEEVAYGIYVCGVEGCDGQKADALGAESFECPKCHTVQKVAGKK